MPPEPPQPPMRPVPPTLAQEPAQAQEASAVEVLRHRLETLEIELAREREKAQAADALLKQREAMRTEVEGEIRRLSEQFRQAKNVTQLEEERSQYRGRIEALEARLGELHASLTSLVQKALERPDPAPAPAPSPAAGGEVHSGLAALAQALERAREESSRRDEELRSSVRSMEELLRQPPAGLREALAPLEAQARALEGLQAELADGARRGADEERSLREQLREAVSGFAGEAAERLAAIDSRLAERLQDDAERLKAVERDRETLRQELQGEAREIRREASEARRDADETFERRLQAAAGALAATAAEQARARETAEELAKAARRLTEALERSPQAREQLLRDFEEERAALLARLREKEDAAPILEERDALRRELERLKGRLESLELERDAQTRALADEGLRARESAAESARRDRELQEAVEARRLAESAAQDLRRQLEALARHLASLESRAGPDAQEWAREREQLRASLRAKDEMLSMLSETFSGLLRRSGVEPDAR